MTQTVPATAVLGPGMTGLTIGLRVLNLDGTEYAAFSTTSVAETSTAGTYRKAGGVVAPLAGGYIVWGTALVDYAEATVESAAVNVTMQQGVAVAAADVNGNVPVVLHGTQPAVTFGQVKILANVASQGALHVVNSHANGHGQCSEGGYAGQYNNGNHAGQTNTGNYAGQTNYGGAASVVGAASQEIADALKRAPAAGTPAVGSVYDLLGDVALEATAQAILEDTGTTLPTAIAAIEPGGGSYAGDGTGYYSDTIDDGTSPLDGVRVQLYTSPNRVGPAYEAYTNALGVFEMWPDPGTYYRWLDLAGYNFSQDVAVTVTEP